MRVVVLGRGVLANAIVRALPSGWEAFQASRRDGVNLYRIESLTPVLLSNPALIINAAGVIDGNKNVQETILSNTVGPHLLSVSARCPVIHISTDCVFAPVNGRVRAVGWRNDPDVTDLYSMTKAAGEIPQRQLVVRTSFVGEGTRMWTGILDAAARSDPSYPGWLTAWSGGHVDDVARVITHSVIPAALGGTTGVIHVARRKPIRKELVARLIVKHLGLSLRVRPTMGAGDRILSASPGYELGSFLGEDDE